MEILIVKGFKGKGEILDLNRKDRNQYYLCIKSVQKVQKNDTEWYLYAVTWKDLIAIWYIMDYNTTRVFSQDTLNPLKGASFLRHLFLLERLYWYGILDIQRGNHTNDSLLFEILNSRLLFAAMNGYLFCWNMSKHSLIIPVIKIPNCNKFESEIMIRHLLPLLL